MDDEDVLGDEVKKGLGDLGEKRLVLEEVARKTVDGLGFSRNVALWIYEAVVFAPCRNPVEEFDAADLDQPVALARIESGRFGVQNDFAHVGTPA